MSTVQKKEIDWDAVMAQYAPGTPYSTHPWDDTNPMWSADQGRWCSDCGTAEWKAEAHKPCPGPAPVPFEPPSRPVLIPDPEWFVVEPAYDWHSPTRQGSPVMQAMYDGTYLGALSD